MGKPTTIYDIAKAAGVAPSTVSRAFSRPGRLNAATVERVRAVARELGYRSAALVPQETRTRTRMIALIVPDITNPFYFEIIRGAETAASESGYTLVLADTQESQRLEQEALSRAMPVVDGLLLTTTRMSDSSIVTAAKERPLVVLNREVAGVPSVVSDNAGGGRRAVEHLGDLGHSGLTYVAGPPASWADGMRWRSVHDTAASRGLRVRQLGPFTPTVEGGAYAAQAFLDVPTTSVICYNDQLAIGLIRGLRQHGVKVPGEVSVVGFDNTMIAELVTPGLTTVATPLVAMGSAGVQRLLAQIGGSPNRATSVVLPSRLVVRDSTGPRRRRRAPRAPLVPVPAPAPGTSGGLRPLSSVQHRARH
jgi:LacI family transcriptional regulator